MTRCMCITDSAPHVYLLILVLVMSPHYPLSLQTFVDPLGHATTAANLLAKLAPSAGQSNNGSEASRGNADRKDDLQAIHISVDDRILLALRESVANFSRAGEDERHLIDVGS